MFIPEYAKNFNKGLSETDIKFYGKIHFDRSRSDNELNMHCHLIVSRKDQDNKKKLSPLTNHKNTKKGTVTGGFDRVNIFQQVEQGFDKLFKYNRQSTESFDYRNTMKNGTIIESLNLLGQEFQSCERKVEISQDSNQENSFSINLENKKTSNQVYSTDINIVAKQGSSTSFNQKSKQTFDSFNSFILPEVDYTSNLQEQTIKFKKKKKKRLRL